MATNDIILDSKLYELALTTKNHTEVRREEINKYYTSLFTAIVSVMPFISNIDGYRIILLLIVLSILAITLSISWVLTLKRIYNFINGLDKLLITLEKKHDKYFITFLNDYLQKVDSPDRVTKQQMIVPYTFIAIFLLILTYCITLIMFFSIATPIKMGS